MPFSDDYRLLLGFSRRYNLRSIAHLGHRCHRLELPHLRYRLLLRHHWHWRCAEVLLAKEILELIIWSTHALCEFLYLTNRLRNLAAASHDIPWYRRHHHLGQRRFHIIRLLLYP